MTTDEKTMVVQREFAHIEDNADAISRAFYRRLFEERPSLRPLFSDDMNEQRGKLMKTLALIVNNLAELERVRPMIEALARRHLSYGVQSDHYDLVGATLLAALAEGLGERFTDELRAAWTRVYGVLADIMVESAETAEMEAEDMTPASYLPGGAEYERQAELDRWMPTATWYRNVP